MSVVLLGDSISVGAFPYLKKRRPEVELFAKVGAPISWMLEQVPAIATRRPRVVLIMGGTNDLVSATPETVVGRLGELVRAFDERGVESLLVSTIPPQKTANAGKVSSLNAMILERGRTVDVGSTVLASDLGLDGVHPGPAGYEKIAAGWDAAIDAPETKESGFPAAGAAIVAASLAGLWWIRRSQTSGHRAAHQTRA